jgi:hypothetical protein
MNNNKEEEQAQPQLKEGERATVSWYKGTTSLELFNHMGNSVMQKLDLQLHGAVKLANLQVLDEFQPSGSYDHSNCMSASN